MLLFLACAGSPVLESDEKTPDSATDTETEDSASTSGPPPDWAGDGADGPVEITSAVEVSALGVGIWHVLAVEGSTVQVDHEISGLEVGTEVLLLVVHGTRDVYADAGRYLFSTVEAVEGDSVLLAEAPDFELDVQTAVLQTVPHFTDVEVSGSLTPPTWDGLAGGVLAFRASGTVHVAEGGMLAADGKGYAGGDTGPQYGWDGYQGASYTGIGSGGGNTQDYNAAFGGEEANGGGGGACVSGAGGNHAGGAGDGTAWNDAAATPQAGESYGEADLSRLFMGSGGGGVWNGAGEPGPGGNGGGIIFVAARTIVVDGAAGVAARGAQTDAWAEGSFSYGAGGGAGGSIWLMAERLELVAGAADATGGLGMSAVEKAGGDGGEGRVRLDAVEVAGVDLDEASLPAPGHIGSPD